MSVNLTKVSETEKSENVHLFDILSAISSKNSGKIQGFFCLQSSNPVMCNV